MRPATIAGGSPSPSVTATTPAANQRPRCAPPHPRTARKATAGPRAEQPPWDLELERAPARQRAPERDLVGVLEVAADRQEAGKACDGDVERPLAQGGRDV